MSKEDTLYKIRKLIKSYEKRQENIQESSKKTKKLIKGEFSPESIAKEFELETLNAESSLIDEIIADLKKLLEDTK